MNRSLLARRLFISFVAAFALVSSGCESKPEEAGEKEKTAKAEGAAEEGAGASEPTVEGGESAESSEDGEAAEETPSEPKAEVLVDVDAATLVKTITSTGKVTLVNAWATWCAPCVEEFPYLMKLREQYADQGLEVIFVSADFEKDKDKTIEFLQEQGVDFTTYRQSGDEDAFINGLNTDWDGALPATFIYDATGKQVKFHPTSATFEEFEAMVKEHLGG